LYLISSSAVVVKLPIAEEDAVSRLQEIEINFKNGRQSTGAIATYFITALLGGLPNFMTKHVLKRPWPPYLISPIVGPQQPVFLKDIPVQELNFTMACFKYGNIRYIKYEFKIYVPPAQGNYISEFLSRYGH